ncbi:MAG: hypothetical protein O3C20_24560 [Verrucomicrobia bacterium]|nr:hypothetical protein [Verrucomicrobiota bacterium]
MMRLLFLSTLVWGSTVILSAAAVSEPTVIKLEIPPPRDKDDSTGGILVVQNRNELHIYQNPAPNPRPEQKSLWENRNYRRLKQCHNYYSP